jgi:hypothetical protein
MHKLNEAKYCYPVMTDKVNISNWTKRQKCCGYHYTIRQNVPQLRPSRGERLITRKSRVVTVQRQALQKTTISDNLLMC